HTMRGFVAADIPDGRYLLTWSEMINLISEDKNYKLSDIKTLVTLKVAYLAEKLATSGFVPKHLYPEQMMFMVRSAMDSHAAQGVVAILIPVLQESLVKYENQIFWNEQEVNAYVEAIYGMKK
ncbi:MAG: hypothetical protein P4L69_22495, partial [Desulfosporosinus sp.]|nr:hypothetical protein [Desulfosporosinus sp.]